MLNFTLDFNAETVLRIESNCTYLKKMSLFKRNFSRSVELPDKYGFVMLNNVCFDNDVYFTVNSNCKDLMILQCAGSFDFLEADRLESLRINFLNRTTKKYCSKVQ